MCWNESSNGLNRYKGHDKQSHAASYTKDNLWVEITGSRAVLPGAVCAIFCLSIALSAWALAASLRLADK
jgi:hypothetical protein